MVFLLSKRHPRKHTPLDLGTRMSAMFQKIVGKPCRFLNALHVVWIGRRFGAAMRPDPSDIASRPLSIHIETESVHDLRRWICCRRADGRSRDIQEIC